MSFAYFGNIFAIAVGAVLVSTMAAPRRRALAEYTLSSFGASCCDASAVKGVAITYLVFACLECVVWIGLLAGIGRWLFRPPTYGQYSNPATDRWAAVYLITGLVLDVNNIITGSIILAWHAKLAESDAVLELRSSALATGGVQSNPVQLAQSLSASFGGASIAVLLPDASGALVPYVLYPHAAPHGGAASVAVAPYPPPMPMPRGPPPGMLLSQAAPTTADDPELMSIDARGNGGRGGVVVSVSPYAAAVRSQAAALAAVDAKGASSSGGASGARVYPPLQVPGAAESLLSAGYVVKELSK